MYALAVGLCIDGVNVNVVECPAIVVCHIFDEEGQRVNERQIREDIVGWAISGTLGSVLGAGDGFGKNSLFSGGSSDKKLGRSVALSVIAV